MNGSKKIIIANWKTGLWLATAVLAIAPAVLAHAGFRHVMGTVAQVSDHVLSIKTAQGNVEVKTSDRTELSKNNRTAQLTDLKPGARVVAEVPEESKDNTAQSVKIGIVVKTPVVRQKQTS